MKEPVRILSDLHLGHRVSRIERVESLRPLLAGAGTVIFNGDTWQELARDLKQKSVTMLGELKEICRQEGCVAIFLPGNHDPGWLGKGYAEFAGGKVIVTHGDSLLRSGAPWKHEVLKYPELIEGLWTAHPGAATDPVERHQLAREIARTLPSTKHSNGRKFAQRAWDAIHPPERALEMLKAWWTQASAGAAFCGRYFPDAEFLLIGHFHWDGSWLCRGKRIINTGSFLNPGKACWVDYENGWLTRGVVDESGGFCRKGRVLDRWSLAGE